MLAPGGGAHVRHLNDWLQGTLLAAGLPSAPHWIYEMPLLLGTTIGDLWNSWAADLSAMAAFFRPYLGAVEKAGYLLLSIANGVVAILLALFISFFFFLGGDLMRIRVRALARRIAGDADVRMLITVGRMVRGTVYAILGTALVQSLLTFVGLTIAGACRARRCWR